MTRRALILLSVIVTGVLYAADPAEGVREASRGWREGAVKQDKSSLQRFLADDLVYTHGGGKSQTKAEYITDVTTGPAHYDAFNPADNRIRVFGKVATLTGLVDVKPAKGEPYRVRTFEVYVNNGGQWQLAQKESARVSQ